MTRSLLLRSNFLLFSLLVAVGAPAWASAQEGAGSLGTPTVPPEPQMPAGGAGAETPPVATPVATPPVEGAYAPTFRGSEMTVSGQVYPLGCNAGMHFVFETNVYVQCADTVVKVDLATGRVLRAAVRGMPTSFFERGGRVWVELNHSEAFPVESLGAAQAAAQPAVQPYQPAQAQRPGAVDPELQSVGEVIEFDSGEVRIHYAGVTPSVYSNARVAFLSEGHDPVVGTVVRQTGNDIIARVAYDQSVPVGARAQFTDAPTTGHDAIPARTAGLRIQLGLRGLVGAGYDGGGGIMLNADLEWRLRAPVFLRLLIDPVGAGFGDNTIASFSGHFILGYDSDYITFGLAIGAQLVEAEDDSFVDQKGIGTSIGFLARVGSPEGFHVEIFNAMTYVDRFRFGSLRIRAQWPIAHRSWMVIRGSGGVTRSAYGEVGFRRLIGGWGTDRPKFMTATFGGAAFFSDVDGYNLYAGPSFGLSFETVL